MYKHAARSRPRHVQNPECLLRRRLVPAAPRRRRRQRARSGAILIIQNGSHGVLLPIARIVLCAPEANKLPRAKRLGRYANPNRPRKIKTPGFFLRDAILNQAGGSRESISGVNAGHDDHVDFGGSVLVFASSNFAASVASAKKPCLIDHMTFADAGAGTDPFVIGVDNFFQVRVGHAPVRAEIRPPR